jgi:hypothetical protein
MTSVDWEGSTRMTPRSDTGLRACKPVLSAPERVVAGYRTLHLQEAKYTGIALREMSAGIEVWHRYLTLLDQTLRGEHDSLSEGLDDAHVAWTLRLALAGAAAATAKMALDAALAWYYSQAYALIRHLLETWLQMLYIRLNNHAAWQWFGTETRPEAQEPSQNTIINGIKRRGKGDWRLLNNLKIVEEKLRALNSGAHPSALILAQLDTGKPGFRQLGANFNTDLLRYTLSIGTVALAMLLFELTESVPVDAAWWDEFEAIREARTRWHEETPGVE